MEICKLTIFIFFCLFSLLTATGNQTVQGSPHHHHHQHQHHHHHHHRHHHRSRGGLLHGFHPTQLFVFGDSYADTGNTAKSMSRSWKVPYGITFPGKPAGRFSDGRVLTDYLAKSLGLKSPVPYRWRKFASNRLLQYGINFAYGGTGVFDTFAFYPNMTTQIDFFQNIVSSQYGKWDLQSSLALVTLAGNDYANYLAFGGSIKDLPTFITRVVKKLASDLRRIHGMGVRKVAVTALPPLGCLPGITASNSFQKCNATLNTAVRFHNLLLGKAVAKLNNETRKKDSSAAFIILDLYGSFISVLNNKGGYLGSPWSKAPLRPCCMGVSSDYSCGSVDEKGAKMYKVCAHPESAFFWDSVHPTQAGWRAVCSSLKPAFVTTNN